MVQRAIVLDLCDQCQSDTSGDLNIEAEFVMKISVNGDWYAVDLCMTHYENLTINEVIRGIARRGSVPKEDKGHRSKRIVPRVHCELCGKEVSQGSGLALHMKTHAKAM